MNYIAAIKRAVAAHEAGDMNDSVFLTTVNAAMGKFRAQANHRTTIRGLPSRMGHAKTNLGRKTAKGKALEN